MIYTPCPACGAQKHQLKACPKCGFTKARAPLKKNVEVGVSERKPTDLTRRQPDMSKRQRERLARNRASIVEGVRVTDTTSILTDEQIRKYLEQHPETEEIGKFGVPQDKYRWGFYGHKTMEYDQWGKPPKD